VLQAACLCILARPPAVRRGPSPLHAMTASLTILTPSQATMMLDTAVNIMLLHS
jgi:hypothetical protein